MCIIAVKPAGKDMFPDEQIETMFWNNKDGAGFMYPENGGVRIRKGFMDLKSLKKALAKIPDVKNKTVVLHCRIATAGGVKPAMTHPFPLSDKDSDLNATDIRAAAGFAHNGVLGTPNRKDYSDSADFMKYVFYPLSKMVNNWRKNQEFMNVISFLSSGSRFAILLSNGTCIRTGTWEEDDGYFYSNTSYMSTYKRYSYGKSSYYGGYYGGYYSGWDDYGDTYYGTGYKFSDYNSKSYDANKKTGKSDEKKAEADTLLLPTSTVAINEPEDYSWDCIVDEDYFDGETIIPLDPEEYLLEDYDGEIYEADGFWIDDLNDIWREVITDKNELKYMMFDGEVVSAVTGYPVNFATVYRKYCEKLDEEMKKSV